jgi:primosomal protein N' (replication factor Y)
MEMPVIKECPNCKSNKVKYFGSSTQKLEDEIAKLYPEATMIRMDIDTVSKKNSHEEILSRFIDEKIDILIGTQMVAKGHDFGNVTLVGILSADSILNFGDYRAVEKTYQTIVQVSGRAGRANKPGRVVIQTYNPDHYAITMAQEQDYKLFYNSEIQLRKMLKYPPFCDIILIRFQGKNLNEIKRISTLIYKILNEIFKNTHDEIFKPVPSPIDKIQGKYRWRIIIKGKVNKNIIEAINYSLSKVKNQGDTTISIDINPNSMM